MQKGDKLQFLDEFFCGNKNPTVERSAQRAKAVPASAPYLLEEGFHLDHKNIL